jgi:catalase
MQKEKSSEDRRPSPASVAGSVLLIAVVVGGAAAAFGYTAGWFSPQRLTPDKLLVALAPPNGPALGHRRNHAKGICFTGVFEANGTGSALSEAAVLKRGRHPAVGRFNLGTPDADAPDATVRVRGMGLQISGGDDGQDVWRTAMINAPVFPVSTPQAFYELQVASKSKDPNAMAAFGETHPEISAFAHWAKDAPWTGSYAEERFNSLDSFVFIDRMGAKQTVRWSFLPAAQVVPVSPGELARRDPDFLEQEIVERTSSGPLRWTMAVTIANLEDETDDPSKAWPEALRTVEVGTLVVQEIEAEPDGPCRDINFDPTVLPPGMDTSDDPFPAARSSVYAKSYDRRTAESDDYPRTATGSQP